jgi:hypothetical protein
MRRSAAFVIRDATKKGPAWVWVRNPPFADRHPSKVIQTSDGLANPPPDSKTILELPAKARPLPALSPRPSATVKPTSVTRRAGVCRLFFWGGMEECFCLVIHDVG